MAGLTIAPLPAMMISHRGLRPSIRRHAALLDR